MAELREQLAMTLGATYTLDRELGGGGMSQIFLAEDTTLRRQVVVKVLPRELASIVSIERFKREIAVVARLQHPHIVPILAAGETDGLPYFTMPFIEGETLRSRLARAGELSIAEALHLLRNLASALAYAHRKGVVHRDIKPENILVSEGHAVIADFGVAKAVSSATLHEASGLTSIGVTLGTPAYMAPEQAVGDPTTDHRADLYAFGLIAYEMLTGRPPFVGRPVQALVAAHLTETPEPVDARRASIPGALAALTMRCLAKDPSDRPQRAEDVLRELDGIHISGETTRAAPKTPTIAILPMVNTTGDVDDEHFSDGLTDELIGAFSKVDGIAVTGRTSTFSLKGKNLSIRAIADLLHVDHVLEGSVRRAGNRLKVRMQLANGDGRVLWSESYDRELADVFAVQEEVAQAVVRALQVKLTSSRGPLVRPGTSDLAAYDLYLKGRHFCRSWGPELMLRAIGYLEQAVERDPTFARAHAWLSNAHWLLVIMRVDVVLHTRHAYAYARSALALDPSIAEAHWATAQLHFGADWDWPAAEREFRHAVALDPGFEEAHLLYGLALLHRGRIADAAAELTETLRIDPLHVGTHVTLGRLYVAARDPDRALAHLKEAIAIQPTVNIVRTHTAMAYLQKQMFDEAIAEFEIGGAFGSIADDAFRAYGYALVGRRDDAQAILKRLVDSGGRAPVHMAVPYVALGDFDEAFRWIERGLAERDPWVTTLTIERAFDPLRSDPRFDALVRRIGFAELN